MPNDRFAVRKGDDGRWHVYNTTTDEDKGGSDTHEDAVSHMRVLYAVQDNPGWPDHQKRR